MYFLGVLPALLLGVGSLAVAISSQWIGRLRFWRRAGWFVALSLALGPGLIVNGLLKPTWGRPRPAHVAEFGGAVQYAPVWSPGVAPGATSFPSGHASMGFFLMVPAFLLYRKHRRLAVLLFALGLIFGSTVGLARMIQGRHFPSDVLWSAACVYYSALFLYVFFRFDKPGTARTSGSRGDLMTGGMRDQSAHAINTKYIRYRMCPRRAPISISWPTGVGCVTRISPSSLTWAYNLEQRQQHTAPRTRARPYTESNSATETDSTLPRQTLLHV
jgi:membrane-associated phospholipid phosphatase